MNIIDSHCHLENEKFHGEEDAVLSRMAEAGVTHAILVASDMQTSQAIVDLTNVHSNLFGLVGVHPHEASHFKNSDLDQLEKWLTLKSIVGIGEIGLDYYYDFSPRDVQKDVLDAQLAFAYEQKKAVCFHIRDAHGDMQSFLQTRKNKLPTGVMHCFSGSVEVAKSYLDMGFMLSFAGPITFKNANKLLDVVAYCPMDRFLIETDSPYLAPVPMRGKRNEPSYVVHVANRVAEIKNIPVETVIAQATKNTCNLYSLPTED